MNPTVLASLVLCFCTCLTQVAHARPEQSEQQLSHMPTYVDVVGDVDGTAKLVSKAASDTIWIATWNFEGCDDTGWVRSDNRALNDGSIYWSVNSSFDGVANIVGEAASLGPLCWDGIYGNDWYQGICIHYVGESYLSFDYLVDTLAGQAFLQVETDSACSSFDQVDYDVDPQATAQTFRDLLWQDTGFNQLGTRTDSIALSGYATSDTHCAYIAFTSDTGYDPIGFIPTLDAGAVVDNVLLEGAMPAAENFSNFIETEWFSFSNLHDTTQFGAWARTFRHITDNDLCTENQSCAWLATDYTTPTLANDPSMAFAPGGYVIKNWLDEVLVGPWVSLSSTASAVGTFVQFRRFGGNTYSTSRIVQNWALRGRKKIANTDTPAPGDSIVCVSDWEHKSQWNSLSAFEWMTQTWDATFHGSFEASQDVQLRFRQSDWQWIAGVAPPSPWRPGPGPFWDRVRIGRQVLTGPVIDEGIDARYQAQDAAPNDPAIESGPMYSQAAGGDIFGTTAFSRSSDLGINGTSSDLIVGDSITVTVQDVLGNGGLTVELYASIVAGPHAGKAPAPHSVGANGFFVITADTSYTINGNPIANRYYVDMDDTYFRGGDALRYFWWATDGAGGATSNPKGLSAVPASVSAAERATGGLFEVNFLPGINWWPTYLARIAADPVGDLDPTPEEIANSIQKNCILYYQNINSRRRSSHLNRTSFMYTLDEWGYAGAYDVYDHSGIGNTNNALGSRMSPEQARNYSLIVYDAGHREPGAPILPDASDLDSQKINMEQWFHTWNSLSGAPNAQHTLWIIGANAMQEKPLSTLYTSDMGATFRAADQGLDVNPDVFGVADFTNHMTCPQTHTADAFAVHGGCPDVRGFDDIGASGSGVLTHVYGKGSPGAAGAIVMNANAAGYSTILQTFAWSDISARIWQWPTQAAGLLLTEILDCALPVNCWPGPGPTDVDSDDWDEIAAPRHTALYQNNPNPFNPMTMIHFDLAQDSHVSLKIYDVAGRLVRTLAKEKMAAGFGKEVPWNGLDNSGSRVPSGVYFYRLEAGDFRATRKLVVMK